MTAGERLAYARDYLGLSLEAIASQTGFDVQVLRSIEETDLPRLPSGARLETAIRAFAAAVQLDAEAISKRYLANLPILADTAEALTAFEPEANEEARPSESGLFVYEAAYGARPGSTSAPPATDIAGPALLLRTEPGAGSPPFLGVHEHGGSHLPRVHRPASRTPIGVLLLVSALAVIGGYLLSAQTRWWTIDWRPRASDRLSADGSKPVRQPDPNVAHAVASDTVPSSPAPAANSSEAAVTAASESATPSGAPLESNETPRTKPAERTTTSANRRPDPRESPVPSAFVVVPGSQPAAAATETIGSAAGGELSGSWNVIAEDEATPAVSAGNRVAYYLRLEQRGSQVAGNGYRVSQSGAEAASSQRPVSVRGTLSGKRLSLNVSGRDRERFVLYRSDDGVFRGRFRREGAPAGMSSVVTLSPRESAR